MLNEQIRAIATKTNTSMYVFEMLSERRRFRRRTDIRQLYHQLMNKGLKVDESAYLDTFKHLHQLGIGKLVIGRKGKPNRFVWNYDLKNVAKIGLGASEEIKKLNRESVKEESKETEITLKVTPEVKMALMELIKKLAA